MDAVIVSRTMKQSLFEFADNDPNDPETVVYRFDIPETEQSELKDFE